MDLPIIAMLKRYVDQKIPTSSGGGMPRVALTTPLLLSDAVQLSTDDCAALLSAANQWSSLVVSGNFAASDIDQTVIMTFVGVGTLLKQDNMFAYQIHIGPNNSLECSSSDGGVTWKAKVS